MSKNVTVRLLVCLGVMSLGVGVARAASCEEYAEQAVIAAHQNWSYGCGYHGLRWSASYRVHYDWCMSVGPARAFPERMERARAIRACR